MNPLLTAALPRRGQRACIRSSLALKEVLRRAEKDANLQALCRRLGDSEPLSCSGGRCSGVPLQTTYLADLQVFLGG